MSLDDHIQKAFSAKEEALMEEERLLRSACSTLSAALSRSKLVIADARYEDIFARRGVVISVRVSIDVVPGCYLHLFPVKRSMFSYKYLDADADLFIVGWDSVAAKYVLYVRDFSRMNDDGGLQIITPYGDEVLTSDDLEELIAEVGTQLARMKIAAA